MGVLCELNNIKLEFSQKELIDFGIDIANGNMTKDDIKDWIIKHTVDI